MSAPLRALAVRAGVEITARQAAKLAELDGLLWAGTLRAPAIEVADPEVYRRRARGVLGELACLVAP